MMKKFAAFLLAFLMVLGCVACGNDQSNANPTTAPTAAPTEAPAVTQAPGEEIDPGMEVTPTTVMSYADYVAAAVDP